VKPSAGCGKANPPAGAQTIASQGGNQAYIVSLPPGYDPNKPYPLAFAFHGYGRTHADCQRVDCPGFQSVLGPTSVLVYMKSISVGWEQSAVVAKNTAYFSDVLAHMRSNYCIDESRVTVAGTSSGAAFVNHLGCKVGDQLFVVAPIAGSLADRANCKGYPNVVTIHGIADKGNPRSGGESSRDFFVERSGCTKMTVPDLAMLHTRIMAARTAGRAEYGCVDYQGCTKASQRWCVHSEGGYQNLNHGWPTFGGKMIADFIALLKR
jgi:poly(3-hydroxybutyrate) depolymerase